jgi:hypothetical protein
MAASPHTLLRNVVVAVLTADATVRTLCGRTVACAISWSALYAATYPVIATQVSTVAEIDGIDDPHEALMQFSCFAEGARGLEVSESLAQRVRELVGTVAVTGVGIAALPEDVATQSIDDAELVPAGRSRIDLSIRYRLEVG